MRGRLNNVVVPLFALAVCGCGDGATDPKVVNMLVDFCASEIPTFFAFQNDGGPWTRVTADANGSFGFDAGSKLILAFVQQSGSDYSTQVVFTTKNELEALNDVACLEDIGTKTLNGTVANVPGQGAQITIGSASTFSTGSPFTLSSVPSGNVDLTASRETFNVTSSIPNRVILRRSQNYSATIPVLDFAAAEAAVPASNTATLGGLTTSETNFIQVYFITGAGTTHSLFFNESFTTATQPIYGFPGTLTAPGDYHALTWFSGPADFSTARAIAMYNKNLADQTLTIGAALNSPSISIAGSSPYVRMRATLASQSDYNSAVTFSYSQTNGLGVHRDWSVSATAGYFGGAAPGTWDLTMPDLSGVSGFPAAGLQTGQSTAAFVEASNARPALFFAPDVTPPTEGEIQKFAYRDDLNPIATSVEKSMALRGSARLRPPQSPFRRARP